MRTQLMIIKKIHKALSDGDTLSINGLSKKTGLHYLTVKRYLKLLEKMKKFPDIEVIKSNSTTLVRIEGNNQ